MLLIIPVIAGVLLFFLLLAIQMPEKHEPLPLRKIMLEVIILLGLYLALVSEVLSLLAALTTAGILVAWTLPIICLLALNVRTHRITRGWQLLRASRPHLTGQDVFFAGTIGIVLIFTFLVGVLSPPNNFDSLLYHLPRVAHWFQSGSLGHHATAYINQLSYPIWSEEAILQIWLLTNSDALSFLVQWLALIGGLMGVTLIVKELGGDRQAQWLSAFFAASLPAVLLQSSSTQNDIITAFWFTGLLLFLLMAVKRPLSALEYLCFSGCLALGMLTKATFYPYAFILLIVFSILVIRRTGWKKGLQVLLIIAAFCVLVNAGYWGRNLLTFGNPFGSQTMVGANVSQSFGIGSLLNPIRNIALNLVTPSDPRNHQFLGWLFSPGEQDHNGYPAYWVVFSWNDEDYAGNPLQVLLLGLTLIGLLINRKRVARTTWSYLGLVLLSYCSLCYVLQYNPYFVRYEIPFFLASAPLFGLVFRNWLKDNRLMALAVLLLFVSGLPWLLINKTRPLIALRDHPEPLALKATWVTGNTAGSILLEPRSTAFFARAQQNREAYLQMAEVIDRSGCRNIGLRIDSSDPEYPFWWILGAPFSAYRLESIFAFPEAERYLEDDLKTCAVICTICQEQPNWSGFDLVGRYDNAFLYFKE
jgi:hypothetical protein